MKCNCVQYHRPVKIMTFVLHWEQADVRLPLLSVYGHLRHFINLCQNWQLTIRRKKKPNSAFSLLLGTRTGLQEVQTLVPKSYRSNNKQLHSVSHPFLTAKPYLLVTVALGPIL